MDAIRTEGLRKNYGAARGVERVDLRVRRGDFFGFIGPNGAGKSTTIRALLGLIRPSGGRAEVLGLDVARERTHILARVGYLPAEAALYPGMRARELFAFSAGLRGRDCGAAAARLCERLRIDPARRVDGLSLGERKKVAIVCALQHEPELLILDEPTGGLDPLMQRELFAILREHNEAGATVFLSSHILSEVQHHCNRAALIREGKIVADGSVAELMRSGARRVRVRGRVDVAALGSVRDLRASAEGVDFLYGGEPRALLAAFMRGEVRDLSITEPDLEEVFLHYYAEGGGADDHLPA